MQKRYQILADYAASGSFAACARENRVSYNTARAICEKFIATGDCQAGARGKPASPGGVLRYISDGDVRMRRNC